MRPGRMRGGIRTTREILSKHVKAAAHMGSGIGSTLHDARVRKGVSLEEAARHTLLRESYLAALERDDIATLGLDPAYIRGTLRTYAAYLGLDADALIAGAHDGGAPSRERRKTKLLGGRVARALSQLLVLSVVAVVAFAAGDAYGGGAVPALLAGTPARALLPDADVDAASDAPATTTAGRDATADRVAVRSHGSDAHDTSDSRGDRKDRAKKRDGRRKDAKGGAGARDGGSGGGSRDDERDSRLRLKLTLLERSWIEVTADGRTELAGVHEAGAVQRFRADRELVVRSGVPGAVRFTYNGRTLGRIGRGEPSPVTVRCGRDGRCRVDR